MNGSPSAHLVLPITYKHDDGLNNSTICPSLVLVILFAIPGAREGHQGKRWVHRRGGTRYRHDAQAQKQRNTCVLLLQDISRFFHDQNNVEPLFVTIILDCIG